MRATEKLRAGERKTAAQASAAARRVADALVAGRATRTRARARSWLLVARESDLLFASWPVDVDGMRRLVPPPLQLDLFDGVAWVTIETLRIDTVRFRNLPPPPRPIAGLEVNMRTYVRHEDVRGVLFLSMDCPDVVGNAVWRTLYDLPFHTADLRLTVNGDNYHAESLRLKRGAPDAQYGVSARLSGTPRAVEPGSADAFLLDQTVMFHVDTRGRLYRGDIAHRSRVIQPAGGIVEVNTLAASVGLTLAGQPQYLRYSPGDDAVMWAMAPVKKPASKAKD